MGRNRRPDPEPLEGDDLLVVTAGTLLWALALAALVLVAVVGELDDRDSWVWVSAAGVLLGLIGIRQVRRRRTRERSEEV